MSRRPQIPVALLTHPFELALGLALIANGLRGFLGDVTPSLEALPFLPRLLYLIVSTLGGLGVIIGLTLPSDPRNRRKGAPIGFGIALERASLYLVAAAYAGLGILLVANNGSKSYGTAIVVLIVGAACILRTVGIRRTTQVVLATLERRRRESP